MPTVRWRIARRVAKDRVISVVEPEARLTHESSSVLRDGYTAQSVGEPEPVIHTSGDGTEGR